jgi:hypothetical protein
MAFAKSWIVEILFLRLQIKGILSAEFFKKEALPYSSVWIDSNSSWMEIGCQRPTEMCGRQGVSVQSGCVYAYNNNFRFTRMQRGIKTEIASANGTRNSCLQ